MPDCNAFLRLPGWARRDDCRFVRVLSLSLFSRCPGHRLTRPPALSPLTNGMPRGHERRGRLSSGSPPPRPARPAPIAATSHLNELPVSGARGRAATRRHPPPPAAKTPPLIQDPEGSGKHKFEHLNAKNKVAQVGKVVSTPGWRRPVCVVRCCVVLRSWCHRRWCCATSLVSRCCSALAELRPAGSAVGTRAAPAVSCSSSELARWQQDTLRKSFLQL